MSHVKNGLYGSGLERDDWYLLRDVLIEYSQQGTAAAFAKLPERLKASPVGLEIAAYLRAGDHSRHDSAVALMAPGMNNVYLLLEKS